MSFRLAAWPRGEIGDDERLLGIGGVTSGNGSEIATELMGVSSIIPTAIDPSIRPTERLGEGEPDIGDEPEQKKTGADDVIAMLGRGDVQAGRLIADEIGPSRLAYLIEQVERDGMVGAAPAIATAANDARKRLSAASPAR